jgi:hypothetical protein
MSKWHGGKGSKRRDAVISQKEFEDAWDKIFPRKKGKTKVHRDKTKYNRVDSKKEMRDNIKHGND